MSVSVSVDRAYVRSSTRHYSSEALQAGAFRSRGRVIQRLGDALCVRPQQPLVCQITSRSRWLLSQLCLTWRPPMILEVECYCERMLSSSA